MNSSILPTQSRGYIKWTKSDNETYKVTVLKKNSNGTFGELESASTRNSYYRLNLNYQDLSVIYYVVESKNQVTGVISHSDTISAVPTDHNPYTSTCGIKCNGKTYAWSIDMTQQLYGAGGNGWSATDPAKLFARSTSEYFDLVEGVDVPFYQAISLAVYNALPTNHPYKQIITNFGYRYRHIPIFEANGYFDANNNPVVDGWLIEKKMDQFTHFQGDYTSIIQPSATFCDMTTAGWMNTYNQHYSSDNGAMPALTEFSVYQNNIVPNQLTCNASGSFAGGTGSPWTTSDWGLLLDDMIDCFNENTNIWSIADCYENGQINGGSSDLIFQPISGIGETVRFKFNRASGQFDCQNQNLTQSDVTQGLYNVFVYAYDGRVFQTVVEHRNEAQTEDKDHVTMTISPNPIENQLLKVIISTTKNMEARLLIYTLTNEVLFNEVIELSTTSDVLQELSIVTTNTPYNQIRVKLIFEDESSMIQRTAIR